MYKLRDLSYATQSSLFPYHCKMSSKLAFSVRKATPEDAPTIRDIQLGCLEKVFHTFYTETVLNKWTSVLTASVYVPKIKSPYWFYVATIPPERDEEKVIGYGFLNTNARRPQLVPEKYGCKLQVESLYIDVEYQRRGIGRTLMEELEKEALKDGCSRVGVLASLPGVEFYSKMGYCTAEESVPFDITKQTFTPGEYSIETVVMYKDLTD